MSEIANLFADELAELEAHEKAMEEASGIIRAHVVVFGKHLSEIYESSCWKAKKYKNFDEYCEHRWQFTGARGRQLCSAYDVAKNLAAMTEETHLPVFLFEHFTESHARVLNALPPDQQRVAWQAATASGEPPTAKTLSAAVEEVKAKTPADVYAMTKEEQHAFVSGIEEKAEEASINQEAIEVAALAMKRLRAVAASIRDEKFGTRFGEVAPQITNLQNDLEKLHEQWTAPLLEAAS